MINHFKMGGNLHIFFSGGKNAAGEGSGSGGPSGALNAFELLSTEQACLDSNLPPCGSPLFLKNVTKLFKLGCFEYWVLLALWVGSAARPGLTLVFFGMAHYSIQIYT